MAKKENKRSSSSSSNEIESKKTKKKKMRGVGGINSLPDSILHHVLSFLTMREAIQTSLVSKRWRYLWTSLPTLNFTKVKGKEKVFVNTTFLLRDIRSNIQRFSITDSFAIDDDELETYSDSDSDSDDDRPAKKPNLHLNIWILTAIRSNVEEIHLEFSFSESVVVKLPDCLFNCNSLKKLELISLDSKRPPLILPDSISLPMLQILHIERFTLDQNHEGDFKINDLLSNSCPSLESLTLNECGIQTTNLNIVAHNLKHLVINVNGNGGEFVQGSPASLRLYAPNLISFHCKDYLSKNYCLENLSSLVEAHIHMKVRTQEKLKAKILEYGRQVERISGVKKINFRILHNVKHLKLSAWALQIFISTYGSLESASTEFRNLRSLELNTWLSVDCIRGITCLLHISPNIVKLSVKIIKDTITPVFPQWDEIDQNPSDIGDYLKLPLHCMLDHLKFAEIRGLGGTVNEVKFLEILLKNAVVLKELTVGFSPDYLKDNCYRKKKLVKYSKNLQSFPKASSSVSILCIS